MILLQYHTNHFIDIKSFPSHYGPGVNTASIRNEYQEHFLWVFTHRKCSWYSFLIAAVLVRKADNLPPPCAVVMKSGNLNFLEPSGPLQTCNGFALLLTIQSMPRNFNISIIMSRNWGTAVAQWLRCCATNRKVSGSIPAGVIGIFH